MNWEKLDGIFKEIDGVLLTSAHNLRYFTGFQGGEGIALITPKTRCLFVDSRYTVAAQEEAADFTVVEFGGGNRNQLMAEQMEDIRCIGYEDSYLTVAEFQTLQNVNPALEWKGISQRLEPLRMIKTPKELDFLRQAEQIGVDAFLAVLPQIKVGVTENEIAAELEYQMRKRGGEGTSFETIAVSGVKSSMPHGKPDNKKLENGDFVTMDFGCRWHGYCSDMTRTVAIGDITEEQRRIYDTVQKAQQTGLDSIRAGITGKEADTAARRVIADAGYGAFFGHSLGHGVGLLIHELPNLSPRSETVLQPGMIVTCEPGIYVPGLGGVRIEDMVCVTEDGMENLTHLSKDLLIL
ncbi:MAG: Xaa-Pro peptidase family protein [Clostridia bacterium]|nr:Xaa-Pro peptidase family protein [Clostridia bacterium]